MSFEFVELKGRLERKLLFDALEIPLTVKCCGCGASVDMMKATIVPNFQSYPVKTNEYATILCDNVLCISEWLTYTDDERIESVKEDKKQ